MPGDIPRNSFRTKHGFAIRPELDLDAGPGGGYIIGQNASRSSFEAIYLGKQAETPYNDIWIDTRGAHVLYVMGKRRSGKSYTLGVLAEGLGATGWIQQGSFEQGVLILDTMNVYLTMPFSVQDTYGKSSTELNKWRLDSEEIPLTLFHPRGFDTPESIASYEISLRPSDLGSDEWCGLFDADPFADPLGHLITELFAKVTEDGFYNEVDDVEVPPNPDFTVDDLIFALENDPTFDRYHRDTVEALRRRLDAVNRIPIFSGEGLDVRELVRPRHVSVLLLRDLETEMRAVLVALIVKRVMQLRAIAEQQERLIPIHQAQAERLAESDPHRAAEELAYVEELRARARQGIPRAWIIIDEAHNYIPSKGSVPSRKPLKKYVDEGRNLGLSIVVATQQPSGLDPSIQRNADMLLVHSLSHRDDIRAAEGMINTDVPDEVSINKKQRVKGPRTFESIVRNLPQGYALVSTDRANRLFPVTIRPRITVHGGTEY